MGGTLLGVYFFSSIFSKLELAQLFLEFDFCVSLSTSSFEGGLAGLML